MSSKRVGVVVLPSRGFQTISSYISILVQVPVFEPEGGVGFAAQAPRQPCSKGADL